MLFTKLSNEISVFQQKCSDFASGFALKTAAQRFVRQDADGNRGLGARYDVIVSMSTATFILGSGIREVPPATCPGRSRLPKEPRDISIGVFPLHIHGRPTLQSFLRVLEVVKAVDVT